MGDKKHKEKKVAQEPTDIQDNTEGKEKKVQIWVKKSELAYEKELTKLQIELLKFQNHVKDKGLKVLILIEGRDAAGKGGTIKRMTEHLNPRGARIVALSKPSDTERTQWYFQRYAEHLPSAGEIVLFDRSWYNRAGVEPVMGFCTQEEHKEFLREVPKFESMLVNSGIILFKFYFSVSKDEQAKRFRERKTDPLKQFKLSPVDMDFSYHNEFTSRISDAYERLLLDALLGDASLFIRGDEVEASWKIVDPILKTWEENSDVPLYNYKKGQLGPDEMFDFIGRDGHAWNQSICRLKL